MIAELTQKIASRASTRIVRPDRLIGTAKIVGPLVLKNVYGERWGGQMPLPSDMESSFGETSLSLEGDSRIPGPELLRRLEVEAGSSPEFWTWDFNRDLVRPSESQAFAWFRPESANPRAPVWDMVVMVRYQVYIVSAFPKYGEDGDIVGYDLKGETEERARERIAAWEAKRHNF